MIRSKSQYKEYIKIECVESNYNWFLIYYINTYIKFRPTSRFLLLLRTCEYYKNVKKGIFNKIIYFFIKYQKYKLGLKLNFTIPENVAGKGLQLPHYGSIVINANTKIGENCRIHICTNIGTSAGNSIAPIIGNNVYIGPGVKIYGEIKIANNISIAANSAVSKSFFEEGIIIGGIPAKVIKRKNNIEN